ncbi:MAG TPA: TetR/AcrR family transcriptional regulator [Terriglobales bacterium]|nr:TetR/AcrR family transcriptional regulator [Terriglobales bacterium]
MFTGQRDPDRSKNAILSAAQHLFASQGYESASLADIAAAAKVSRGLPSYFFENKEKLYDAVLARAADELRQRVLQPIKLQTQSSLLNILIFLVESYVDYLSAHPHIIRLLQWEFLRTKRRSSASVPQVLFQETLEVVSAAIPRTSLHGFDLRQLLLSIASMCLWPFQILEPDAALDAFAAERKRHVVQLLSNMLGGRQ